MAKLKDLSGKRFGRLTVVRFDHTTPNGISYYLCLCDCGVEKIIRASNFTHGTTVSCGCYQREEKNKWLRSKTPHLIAPKGIWKSHYADGCSFEKFLELSQQNCFYCGSPPYNKYNPYVYRMKKGTISKEWFDKCWYVYNGLDRIDSNKPHSEDNIVTCCILCNQAKNDLSIEEFKKWIVKLYDNFIIGE